MWEVGSAGHRKPSQDEGSDKGSVAVRRRVGSGRGLPARQHETSCWQEVSAQDEDSDDGFVAVRRVVKEDGGSYAAHQSGVSKGMSGQGEDDAGGGVLLLRRDLETGMSARQNAPAPQQKELIQSNFSGRGAVEQEDEDSFVPARSHKSERSSDDLQAGEDQDGLVVTRRHDAPKSSDSFKNAEHEHELVSDERLQVQAPFHEGLVREDEADDLSTRISQAPLAPQNITSVSKAFAAVLPLIAAAVLPTARNVKRFKKRARDEGDEGRSFSRVTAAGTWMVTTTEAPAYLLGGDCECPYCEPVEVV